MTTNIEPARDLNRTLLIVLFIGSLITGSFWVLRPFLPALIWAAMIVIATWPLMIRVQGLLRGRRGLAITLSTALFLLLFVIPLCFAVVTIASNAPVLLEWANTLRDFKAPLPPDWLTTLPLVGPKLAAQWEVFSNRDLTTLLKPLAPYAGNLLSWFVSQLGGFGLLFVHFLLTIILSIILFLHGESAALATRRFARRLGGEKGEAATQLAGQAIRAVALGVMVTALVQSVVAGIGLAVAGVPHMLLLTALMFVLAVVQIGAVPVMLIVTGWLFWQGQIGWGIAMLIWTALVGTVDSFLRPLLIRRGANLPLLLIFAGVIGGLFAFGVIGLFIGPVILAVSYTLLAAWVEEQLPSPADQG
ncbi:MAG: AI-2E family transporter YdiK [Deltaproteobacteria bacterium]|nr:AI-2E family transporter YdiK [Deltaproteobacteria bacterium]